MPRQMDRRAQDHRIPALDLPGFCPAVCPALRWIASLGPASQVRPTGTLEAHSVCYSAIRVPPVLMWAARSRLPGKCLVVCSFLIGRRWRLRRYWATLRMARTSFCTSKVQPKSLLHCVGTASRCVISRCRCAKVTRNKPVLFLVVIPAQVGIQRFQIVFWMPAFAGTTAVQELFKVSRMN
jgi:hypothetical protein